MKKVYIAGPMCFAHNADSLYDRLVKMCASYNMQAVLPLGPDVIGRGVVQTSNEIYQRDIELLMSSDAVIANISPFRGPSADVGTVFEVAWALAKGKPVFVYDEDKRRYRDKVADEYSNTIQRIQGRYVDHNFNVIEDFGLSDNLMLIEPFRPSKDSGKIKLYHSAKEAIAACREYFLANGKEEKEESLDNIFDNLGGRPLVATPRWRGVPLRAAQAYTVTTSASIPTSNPYAEPEAPEYEDEGCPDCGGDGCSACD